MKNREHKTYSLLRQLEDKLIREIQYRELITLAQFKAQMKDLHYQEWEIDLYLDGDTLEPEDSP